MTPPLLWRGPTVAFHRGLLDFSCPDPRRGERVDKTSMQRRCCRGATSPLESPLRENFRNYSFDKLVKTVILTPALQWQSCGIASHKGNVNICRHFHHGIFDKCQNDTFVHFRKKCKKYFFDERVDASNRLASGTSRPWPGLSCGSFVVQIS